MLEVIVIGGGVAGFGAAFELADRGYQVRLIEKSHLGSGTSGRNPGRMGHGFHYVDPETAVMYLRASIQVQRKYPHYLLGQELPFHHPLRHGRYFITKDSDNPPEQILATYERIKEEYKRLVAIDPKNEVFGPPQDFFRILDPSEYQHLVNGSRVALGIETAEHLFNLPEFLKDIRKVMLAHPNITLHEHTKVLRIERGDLNQPRFTLYVEEARGNALVQKVFRTDYLVNSTWQNIEALNDGLGITMPVGLRTNRLKALLVVKLPESLAQTNSMFFCMGQHGMFSNLGNGYGMMTYAEVTNIETSSELKMSEKADRLLEGRATIQEIKSIGERILAGVAEYIPQMAKALIVDVRFGVVQTAGSLTLAELKDPKSSFHKRDYHGIREEQVGLTSNPCMKLFYFIQNGKVVADLVDAQVEVTSQIRQDTKKMITEVKKSMMNVKHDLERTWIDHIHRFTSSTAPDRLMSTGMIQSIFRKQDVMSELKLQKKVLKHPSERASEQWIHKKHQKKAVSYLDFPDFYLQTVLALSIDWVATLILSISVATLAIGTAISVPFAVAAGVTVGIGASFFSRDAQKVYSAEEPMKVALRVS